MTVEPASRAAADSTPQLQHVFANGVTFAYHAQGADDAPLVLCLHGFPDSADSFMPLLQALAQAGFRAVAPSLRGYAPSSLAPDGDYAPLSLARDVLALVEALGAKSACLVGHDWGAVAAYGAAGLAPATVQRLVVAAVPHPRRFVLRPSRRQLSRSSYMLRFQWPGSHRWLASAEGLGRLVHEWSPDWGFTEGDLAPMLRNLVDPKRRAALLAYYRALPRAVASPATQRVLLAPVPVRTRVLFGADDGCVGREMFLGQEHLFLMNHDQVEIPGVGHFMHYEAPQLFAEHVVSFLSG